MKTFTSQHYNMQTTDLFKDGFTCTHPANSWQWIPEVSGCNVAWHQKLKIWLFFQTRLKKWRQNNWNLRLMSFIPLQMNVYVLQCQNYINFQGKWWIHANLEVWDAELVIGGQIVGPCGGCHHFVPCLLTSFLSRSRDQPKLCHGSGAGAAEDNWDKYIYIFRLIFRFYLKFEQLI